MNLTTIEELKEILSKLNIDLPPIILTPELRIAIKEHTKFQKYLNETIP